jgi:hypothetical protein
MMKLKIWSISSFCCFFIIVITVILTSSCSIQNPFVNTLTSSVPKFETRNPHIRGAITGITIIEGRANGVIVEGPIEEDATYDRASIGFTEDTRYYARTDSGYRAAGPEELSEGQIVEVIFTGPIRTSDPVQATAEEVVLLPISESPFIPTQTSIFTGPLVDKTLVAGLRKPQSNGMISREQAVGLAELYCAYAHSIPTVNISNVEASRMTEQEAQYQLNSETSGFSNRPVWLVSMDGKWEHYGPVAADETAVPLQFDHCIVIIDAASGEMNLLRSKGPNKGD